ncbi:MAG: 2-phospho-L-lactate transferase CofD family protein [Pseudomonadota bacterium]
MFQLREEFETCDHTRTYVPGDVQVGQHRIVMLDSDTSLDALRKADTVVLGPGSLYTSILPALTAPGVADAIIGSNARVVFVMNLMTEPGETDDYSAADFMHALQRHAPGVPVHYLLQNSEELPTLQCELYGSNGAKPIPAALSLGGLPIQCVARDLLIDLKAASNTSLANKLRHDPAKLASAILELSAWHDA